MWDLQLGNHAAGLIPELGGDPGGEHDLQDGFDLVLLDAIHPVRLAGVIVPAQLDVSPGLVDGSAPADGFDPGSVVLTEYQSLKRMKISYKCHPIL